MSNSLFLKPEVAQLFADRAGEQRGRLVAAGLAQLASHAQQTPACAIVDLAFAGGPVPRRDARSFCNRVADSSPNEMTASTVAPYLRLSVWSNG